MQTNTEKICTLSYGNPTTRTSYRMGRLKSLALSGLVGLASFVGLGSCVVSPSELSYLWNSTPGSRSGFLEDNYSTLVEGKNRCSSGSDRHEFLESLDGVFSRSNITPLYPVLRIPAVLSIGSSSATYLLLRKKK